MYLEKPDPDWLSNAKIEMCSQCKVALLCYANRPLLGYWCEHCVGFYLFDLNILVQCTEFQSVTRSTDYMYSHAHELICCTKRRQNQLEVFGGMIIRQDP